VTIVVVGAGIIGCSVAYELAVRGASVRVIDFRAAGDATRASAGTLAPYIEGHSPALRALGIASLALYDEFVRRVTADGGHDVEYARTGTLQVARDAIELTELVAEARDLGAAGVPHDLVDARDVRQLEGGLADVSGGLLLPEHGFVATQALTQGLAQAAQRVGAVLLTARATRVMPTLQGVEVTTPDELLSADAVVIAAGSWSGQLGAEPPANGHRITGQPPTTDHQPVRPIRGQLVHLRFDTPVVGRVIWGSGCYAVPWKDGSLLVGATVEDVGFDQSSTPEGVRSLARAVADLIPACRGARVQEVRVGLRPMTPDGLPAIGRSSTMRNVFYATGHYRTGVLLAPLTASLIADLVVDGRERPELALVRPGRLGL
jgi:glycine oxidase